MKIIKKNKKSMSFYRISIIFVIAVTLTASLIMSVSADDKYQGYPILSNQTFIEISDTSIKFAAAEISDTARLWQEVEYGLSSVNNINDISVWQTDPEFTGLTPSTQYYIFIRSRESNYFTAGALKLIDPNVTITVSPNFSALDITVRNAGYIENDSYTDESWRILLGAVIEGERLLSGISVTQSELDAAVTAIKEAAERLDKENGEVVVYNTVTYDTNDENELISARVINGNPAMKPVNPVRTGFTFAGWFNDEDLTAEYAFDKPLTDSIILYAKWVENTSTARIYSLVEGAPIDDSPFNVAVPTGVLVDFHGNPQIINVKYTILPNGGIVWCSPFTDVTESDWFFNDVEYVYANALYQGASEFEFEPNSPMTRAMFITVLWRQAGSPNPSGGSLFNDAADDAYYTKAAVWAAENKIITDTIGGLSENKIITSTDGVMFNPESSVTREQMTVILYRYVQWMEKEIPELRQFVNFDDMNEMSEYTKQAIRAFYCAGIIDSKLDTDNIFDPNGIVTRAECAAIFRKFIELFY